MPLCRWRYCIPFQNASPKARGGQIRRFQKAPQINLVTTATSLERSQNKCEINYPHPHVYQSWIVGWDRSSVFWDNWPDMTIFVFFHKSTKISKRFSEVTAPKITEFVHDVATFNVLLSCSLAFRYSYPFRNGSATNKNDDFATWIGCHGDVP